MAKKSLILVFMLFFALMAIAGNVMAAEKCGGSCDSCHSTCENKLVKCGGSCDSCHSTCENKLVRCGSSCDSCHNTCEINVSKCGNSCGSCQSTCEVNREVKEWTFLVFLNADNNLDQFGVKDVNEMEKIGSNDKMNIVVLLDRENGTAKKLYVTKDNDENKISSQVLEELGSYDMGDYKNLVNFVEWGVKNYPAKHYAVDIWNHGSGWSKSRLNTFKGISYDDGSGNHITTPQLGEAMASIYKTLGKKLDILAMDACLMQMAEVTYEIKDYVQYCVASEETEPGDGYTYDSFLAPLASNPEMSAADLAKVMVQGYKDHYASISEASTQSAVDLGQFDTFMVKFDALCAKLAELSSDKAVMTAIKKQVRPVTQAFYYRTNIDLGHFMALIQKNVNNPEVQTLVAEAIALYANGQNPLVISNGTTGSRMANATGLAIYFPTSVPGSDYAKIKFAKTNWMLFLSKYFPAAATL